MNKFIIEKYSNLIENSGVIITKNYFLNSKSEKILQYGFDPYLRENSNTLFYYWWDFLESNMKMEDFENQLKIIFSECYNKKVDEIKALYIGSNKKEIY